MLIIEFANSAFCLSTFLKILMSIRLAVESMYAIDEYWKMVFPSKIDVKPIMLPEVIIFSINESLSP